MRRMYIITYQLEVDSNFISMFNIIATDGDNRLRLGDKQIAITDKTAKKIFGEESPIGKQLLFPDRGNAEMTIVAVVKSWEGHSMYPFVFCYHIKIGIRIGEDSNAILFSVSIRIVM